MNKNAVSFFAGFIAGGLITTTGFVFIFKKYVPHYLSMRDLEDEVNRLEQEKRNAISQIDFIGKEYKHTKSEYDQSIKDKMEEFDEWKETVENLKSEADHIKTNHAESDSVIRDDYSPIVRSQIDNLGSNEDIQSIATGNPRVDGPLSEDEMEEFRQCDGNDDLEYSLMTKIAEQRYLDSIDYSHCIYQITEAEHDDRLDFFDTVYLDYYDTDGILAEGDEMLDSIESTIDPIVLNRFGKQSGTHDPEIVICRNEKLATDYVIERTLGSYQHAVYNIDESDAYVPMRKHNQELADEREKEQQ